MYPSSLIHLVRDNMIHLLKDADRATATEVLEDICVELSKHHLNPLENESHED